MKQALEASAALTGGRAPACQQAALARAAAEHHAIRRACAWVEKMAGIQPKLLEGPLFGTCIAGLTANAATPVETQPQEAAQRCRFLGSGARRDPCQEPRREQPAVRRRAQLPCQPAPKSTQRSDKPSEEPAACRPKPEPAKLPAKAKAALLCRLKGETDRDKRPESRRSLPHNSRPCDTPPLDRRASSSPAPDTPPCDWQQVGSVPVWPAAPPDNAPHRAPVSDPRPLCEWRERVTARASRRLAPAPLPHHRDWIERRDLTKASMLPQEAVPVSPVSLDPWSEPLSGPVAPAALIAGIIEQATRTHARVTGPAAQPRSGRVESIPEFGHAVVPKQTALKPVNPVAATQSVHSPAASATNAPSEKETDFGAPVQLRPPITDDGFGDPEHPSGIVPAQLAVTLPPLRPPRSNATPYQPVTASLIRHGTKEEESSHNANDLGVFEARLRRILNEEARRHGIDV